MDQHVDLTVAMSKYDDAMPKLKALVLSSDSETVPDVPAADIKYARALAQLLEAQAKVCLADYPVQSGGLGMGG